MPLTKGKSPEAFSKNVSTEMDAGKPKKQALAIAYSVKRKAQGKAMGGSVGCRECMATGGKCMKHGGMVENEKLHPEHEEAMPSDMARDEEIEYSPGDVQSEEDRLAQGGMTEKEVRQGRLEEAGSEDHEALSLVDAILHDRSRRNLASGGEVPDEQGHQEPDEENDFERHVDLEPVHNIPDPAHDQSNPSEDDMSLVGQILKDRKSRRRE